MTRPADYWDPILERHPGPFFLLGEFPGKKGPTSAWLKKADEGGRITWTNADGAHVAHDRDDVVGETYGYLREQGGPDKVFVYSAREQQFVGITVHREDACGDASADGSSAAAPSAEDARRPTTSDGSAQSAPVLPTTSAGSAASRMRPPGAARAMATTATTTPAASGRGSKYRFVMDATEKLGTTPALVLAEFKRRGAATVAEVAAALESSLTTADPKGLVASHATRLKAAGLLEKEAAWTSES